jgi:hypothetical protein
MPQRVLRRNRKEEIMSDEQQKQSDAISIAMIAATLMSTGQIGINQLDDAVAKAKELIKRAVKK